MRIGILGCAGRMGRMLLAEVLAAPGAELAGGAEAPGSAFVGGEIGALLGQQPLGLTVLGDAAELAAVSDVLVDFTVPSASLRHAAICAETGTALVLGTTGLTPRDQDRIAAASASAAIVQAANFSLGVNLLLALVERIAASLGPDSDIEIVEMHHRHKVDAPSGTALALGEAAARGRKVALAEVARHGRVGQVGPRPQGEIGFAVLRGGDIAGDHSVIFAHDGERLDLSHRATSRAVFAKGAVRAALWAGGKPPGLYGMTDVLGLTQP